MSRIARQHLERARELVWEAIERMEEAQREMFRAGDAYVAQVHGDGVRGILDSTERMADVSGDLSQVHIEVGKLLRRGR